MTVRSKTGAVLLGLLLAVAPVLTPPVQAAPVQTLTWTGNDDTTKYRSAPTEAVTGETTVVFENSAATGNTTGMPHTLTFDTTTEGYNHDVALNILASPFDTENGRHTTTVTLTAGKYRYFCTIPGHSTMVGELVVTGGGPVEDTTAPTVSASVTGGEGSATVTVTATDSGSGVGTVEYQIDGGAWTRYTAPVVVSTVGEHLARYRATDKAGNTSEPGSATFTVTEPSDEDVTAPTVTAQVSGQQDAGGNYVGPASVTLTATDDDSGVARIEYQVDGGAWTAYTQPVVVNTVGMHMVHYRATDNAGNTSAEQMAHIVVVAPPAEDTTPPTVTAAATGGDGSATVTVTATDAGSGVATIEYALDNGAWTRYTAPIVVTAPGSHTLRYRATDNKGNTAAEQSLAFTVEPGGTDGCPGSDTRATVVIGSDDTGVANTDTGNGCTISDLIAEHATYATHAAFVRHVQTVTDRLSAAGTLTARQAGTIVRAAARSGIGS
ncbi:plastocyanin/azurin family copper-binding protein [Actinoplanes sp. TFC3]|uniref:OmpL47-type beta-barrel domain-containing protein n=1 Tax=Actinoplanes sp. TFC3 TaxID=1710355 RepID=UPI00082CA277|nr:plastocyanin/azurin family copper-binding protein [Actinoplanes sp. TFC3]